MPTIVTAAIIEKDGKTLIAQRMPGKNQGLKWEFPGGKLEEGEAPLECLKREIKEEMDLDIEVGDIFDVVYHKYPNVTILMLAFKCRALSENVKTIDCNDFKWISIDEMKEYVFADADLPIIEKLLSSNN